MGARRSSIQRALLHGTSSRAGLLTVSSPETGDGRVARIARQDAGTRVGGNVGYEPFSRWESVRRESCRDRERTCRTIAAGCVNAR